MHVDIWRDLETANSVESKIDVDGQFVCFGLEPSRKTPVHPGHPCIDAGTFEVILTHSPHLGYVTPEVLNVPGRTAIRWHIANKPLDLLGCTGVGENRSTDWVGSSKDAFNLKLMPLLQFAVNHNDKITVTYHDPS